MAVTGFSITNDRSEVIDFVHPPMAQSIRTLFIKAPTNWKVRFRPLKAGAVHKFLDYRF